MAEPKGLLIVPCGFNPSGDLRALELTAADLLKVDTGLTIPTAYDVYGWDGTNWQKIATDTSGFQKIIPYPHRLYDDAGITAIAKSATANNASVIIHTVTAGKSFYMTSIQDSDVNLAATTAEGRIIIRDTGDATVCEWKIPLFPNTVQQFSMGFVVPVKVPAGYDICSYSNTASNYNYGTITGYEV